MIKKYIWSFIGIIVMMVSVRILYTKLWNLSFADVTAKLQALSFSHWILAVFCALLSYTALAGYDRIALSHLEKKISWFFITLCSFTTYALSHNIGASIFSGAVVRYRAYSMKGLSGPEIAILVGFCSFTFALGTLLLSGFVLLIRPRLITLIYKDLPENIALLIGWMVIVVIGLYILGSFVQMKPLKINRKLKLSYPRLAIVWQQLFIAPLELIGAAGIIFAVLPENGNPGFITVLGVFLASFTVTLLSNAPAGGVGVLEALFISGMSQMDPTDVIAALIVFRILYLIIPFILSIFFIAGFEYINWNKRKKN